VGLQEFKTQAKLLVRWHRERNFSVGGRIRQLSRYKDLSDAETLSLPFPLDEAQEIVALEQGCASWAELMERVGNTPTPQRAEPSVPRVTKGMPVLLVSDVGVAAEFYRDKLGFAIDFLHGQPPFYGSVSRDEACIHLRFVEQPQVVVEHRAEEEVISAFLAVTNVKALFMEYEAMDVPFVHRLREEPWGQSSFIVRDPDGNCLCFAG
jgi:catechol 2,3-dioxygenase-like lactoylglutathione lyase family enzyme